MIFENRSFQKSHKSLTFLENWKERSNFDNL